MAKDLDKYINDIEKQTGKLTKEVEQQLKKEYQALAKKILGELANVHSKYEKDGKLTYEEMLKYNRLNSLLTTINDFIDDLTKGEYKVIAEGIKDNYKLSYEYLAYAFEKETQAYLNYSRLKAEQIQASIDNPVSGLTLNDTLQKNRAQIIYEVKRLVTQSIYQGYSYGKTANLLKQTFQNDYVKSVRVARTEMHRVIEKGKHDSAMKAQEEGVVETKTWKCMRDSRVRDTHNRLHGQTVKVGEMFDLGYGEKGEAPSNTGYAHHDCNCRCYLKYTVVDVQKPKRPKLQEMQFEEWRKKRLK